MRLEVIQGKPEIVRANAIAFARTATRIKKAAVLFETMRYQPTLEGQFFRAISSQFRFVARQLSFVQARFEQAGKALGIYAANLADEIEASERAAKRWDLAEAELYRLNVKRSQELYENFTAQDNFDPAAMRRLASDIASLEDEKRQAKRDSEEAQQRLEDAAKVASAAFKTLPKSSGMIDPPGEAARRQTIVDLQKKQAFWKDFMDNSGKIPDWVDYVPGGAAGRAFATTIGSVGGSKANQGLGGLGVDTGRYAQYWVNAFRTAGQAAAVAGVMAVLPGAAGKAASKLATKRLVSKYVSRSVVRGIIARIAKKTIAKSAARHVRRVGWIQNKIIGKQATLGQAARVPLLSTAGLKNRAAAFIDKKRLQLGTYVERKFLVPLIGRPGAYLPIDRKTFGAVVGARPGKSFMPMPKPKPERLAGSSISKYSTPQNYSDRFAERAIVRFETSVASLIGGGINIPTLSKEDGIGVYKVPGIASTAQRALVEHVIGHEPNPAPHPSKTQYIISTLLSHVSR